MSIGKRFVRLVRSNLNALLDGADESHSRRVEELSDEELEDELRRRKLRREAADNAAQQTSTEDQAWREMEDALGGARFRTTGSRRQSRSYERTTRPPRSGRGATSDQQLAQLYAQLECPYGADINTVRKQYRALMRKYHPDVHSGHPDKQRIATELSQKLTTAYNELRRRLS